MERAQFGVIPESGVGRVEIAEYICQCTCGISGEGLPVTGGGRGHIGNTV